GNRLRRSNRIESDTGISYNRTARFNPNFRHPDLETIHLFLHCANDIGHMLFIRNRLVLFRIANAEPSAKIHYFRDKAVCLLPFLNQFKQHFYRQSETFRREYLRTDMGMQSFQFDLLMAMKT